MTSIVDSNNKRKKNIIKSTLSYFDDSNIPLPSVVEISESGTCNRSCSFCPRSDPNYPNVMKFIQTDLFEKLVKDLALYDYQGILLFSGFVETLLDKNIYNLVSIARHNLPQAKIEIGTNGDVLNINRLKKLFKSGLSTLIISVYDSKEQADGFIELCKKAGIKEDQYVIRHRYYSSEEDFGLTLSNRSGFLKNAEYKIDTPAEPLDIPCFYPHYTFFMDYLGDVLLCPHDWGKQMIVGNMKKQTFKEIWMSKKMMLLRKKLASGNRKFLPCSDCDVKGVLMGREHAKAWEKLSKENNNAA